MAKNYYTTSANGRKLITEFEGEILKVYKDPIGLPTLGVGHLLSKAELKQMPVGTKISKAESQAYLAKDLEIHERAVNNAITVPITQNQFDALVSFSFNVGEGGLRRSSVVRNLNSRQFSKAADSFLLWNKAGGKVLAGLTRRRKAERALFLTPDSTAKQPKDVEQDEQPPKPPAPTTITPDAAPSNLAETPVSVETIVAAKEDTVDEKISKWSARWMAIPATATTFLAGVGSWLTSSPVGITITLIIAGCIVAAIYFGLRQIAAMRKTAKEAELKLQREKQAHELQMALIAAGSSKEHHTVVLTPPTVSMPNSDAEDKTKAVTE